LGKVEWEQTSATKRTTEETAPFAEAQTDGARHRPGRSAYWDFTFPAAFIKQVELVCGRKTINRSANHDA